MSGTEPQEKSKGLAAEMYQGKVSCPSKFNTGIIHRHREMTNEWSFPVKELILL